MKEFLIMLANSKVDFKKETLIEQTYIIVSTDERGSTTTFVFDKTNTLIKVSHN